MVLSVGVVTKNIDGFVDKDGVKNRTIEWLVTEGDGGVEGSEIFWARRKVREERTWTTGVGMKD